MSDRKLTIVEEFQVKKISSSRKNMRGGEGERRRHFNYSFIFFTRTILTMQIIVLILSFVLKFCKKPGLAFFHKIYIIKVNIDLVRFLCALQVVCKLLIVVVLESVAYTDRKFTANTCQMSLIVHSLSSADEFSNTL